MNRLHIMIAAAICLILLLAESGSSTTFRVNTSADLHDNIPGDGICGDPTNPDSTCSLRAAIEETNASSGADSVLVPMQLSPLFLRHAELVLSDDSLNLRGIGGRPIVDGANLPQYASIFRLKASHIQIANLLIQHSRGSGIVIEQDSNLIGGSMSLDRNIIVACGIDDSTCAGIELSGASSFGNRVQGNFIALQADGTTVQANMNGVAISYGAHDNVIGGTSASQQNVISGNSGYGVVLRSGARSNTISGNFIGPDATGTQGPGNCKGGILATDGANRNRIGGHAIGERNLISGNLGDGICLSGSQTTANVITGNIIGLDISAILPLGNTQAGISISEAASRNWIGDGVAAGTNYITANYGDGIRISGVGCTNTTIKGNFIGMDTSGYRDWGNGYDFGYGVYVGDGAAETQIGGSGEFDGNIVGGNVWGGVYLTASNNNHIQGNFIGVSISGQNSAPNGSGIILRSGSSNNLIGGSVSGERNVISGNRADVFPLGAGIAIYDFGTSHNIVKGNKIGTDSLGSRALRNGSCGVIIGNGASYNIIGGTSAVDRNIIAGNGTGADLVTLGRGVHIYGSGTSHNQVMGNYIGIGIDTTVPIENYGNGVGIFEAAANNMIGGNTPEAGNLIVGSTMHGVLIDGIATRENTVRFNRFRANDSLGIAIRRQSQNGIRPPVITSIKQGVITGQGAARGAIIDIYLADPDPSGYGEGAAVVVTGLAAGNGTFALPLDTTLTGVLLTAIATDSSGNTSEFAKNVPVGQVTDVQEDNSLPMQFQLYQNYPNPFNPSTQIRFTLPRSGHARLTVHNMLGEIVVRLVDQDLAAGDHTVMWNGTAADGGRAASGVYVYRLVAGGLTTQRKMLLLK